MNIVNKQNPDLSRLIPFPKTRGKSGFCCIEAGFGSEYRVGGLHCPSEPIRVIYKTCLSKSRDSRVY